jgi:hypothetical protein
MTITIERNARIVAKVWGVFGERDASLLGRVAARALAALYGQHLCQMEAMNSGRPVTCRMLLPP